MDTRDHGRQCGLAPLSIPRGPHRQRRAAFPGSPWGRASTYFILPRYCDSAWSESNQLS
jgi:hypothetical protein